MEIKISESEWVIMDLLWHDSPKTLKNLSDELMVSQKWAYKTVDTFMRRLVKKDVVGFNIVKGNRYYYPLLSREECLKVENASFLNKVYNGSLCMLLTNFIKEENTLTEEEKKYLRSLLDDK
jgi:BlaI family penicillinase repressor